MDSIKTMDDFGFEGKIVLVRCDLNSEIKDNEIEDDRRFLSHVPTLKELIEKNARIVILAHQSRPGNKNFTTMKRHAKKLSEILKQEIDYGKEVGYNESLFGELARKSIKNLNNGEILMLENVRFDSEEVYKYPGEKEGKCPYKKKANTHLVRKLSGVIDIYINDAFGTAHRCQPSVVGFPMAARDSCAGRLMEKELKTLNGVMNNPKGPVTFVLGGAKADDSIEVARRALDKGVDKILVGGVVGNVFLAARYWVGDASINKIRGILGEDTIRVMINTAGDLLKKYRPKIILPLDVAVEKDDERFEIPVDDLAKDTHPAPDCPIVDIGKKTVKHYKEIIMGSKTILANAVMGYTEDEKFTYGTNEILKAIADSNAYSVLGGGSTVTSARKLGLEGNGKIDWMSTGGGASMDLLAGKVLPAVKALQLNAERFS